MRVAVIGGGIAGLSAAHELLRRGAGRAGGPGRPWWAAGAARGVPASGPGAERCPPWARAGGGDPWSSTHSARPERPGGGFWRWAGVRARWGAVFSFVLGGAWGGA